MTIFEALKHLIEHEGEWDGIIEDDADGSTFTHWRDGDEFFHRRNFGDSKVQGPNTLPYIDVDSTFRRVKPRKRQVRFLEAFRAYASGESVWIEGQLHILKDNAPTCNGEEQKWIPSFYDSTEFQIEE